MFHFFSGNQKKKKLWTPALITTALWLDAQDSGTITLNGSTVSQWNDKSGTNNHATQSNAANQPTYNATAVNSKSALTFDGNDVLSLTSNISITSDMLECAVFNRNTAGTNTFLLGYQASYIPHGIWWYTDNQRYVGLGGSEVTIGTASTSTGSFITSTWRNSTNTGIYVNGTGLTPKAASNVAGSINRVGFGGSYYNTSPLGELILLTSYSLEIQQKIEGYLAYKWGLQANLPSDHPYKNTPPYV